MIVEFCEIELSITYYSSCWNILIRLLVLSFDAIGTVECHEAISLFSIQANIKS